jgi:hypothetical protein
MRAMVCLVLMLALEHGNHRLRACTDKLFYPHCTGSHRHEGCTLVYLAIAMLLYWLLLTKSGAFLGVLLYWIVTFASASSTLNQELKNFAGMHMGALSLWEIALCRYQTSHSELVMTERLS